MHHLPAGVRDEHAALDERREAGHGLAVSQRRDRDPALARDAHDRFGRVRGGEGSDLGAQHAVVFPPPVDASELGMVGPLGMPDHLGERPELRRAVGREADPAVGGGLDRRHVDEAPDRLRFGPAPVELRGDRLELVERDGHRFERRHVDVGAVTGSACAVERGERGDAAHRSRHPLTDPASGRDRRLVLAPPAGDRAAPRLQRELGRGTV